MGEEEKAQERIKATRRFFTMEDYENGLCDINGIALPGKPKDPPRSSVANRVRGKRVSPEVAARGARDPSSMSRSGSLQPANQGVAANVTPAVDPLKIENVKPAETGIHDQIPTDDPDKPQIPSDPPAPGA